MGTGIDWNGNGEYDPIDVGIDIAVEDEENKGLFSSKKKISVGDISRGVEVLRRIRQNEKK